MVAAVVIFTLAGCSKSLNIDSVGLEGSWYLVNADERVTEDGSLQYTFLADGSCFVTTCNFLDPSADATHFSVRHWSLVEDTLSIDTEGGFVYNVARESKDKILCKSDQHDTEYYLVRETGTDYKAVVCEWLGEKPVTMTDNDGVQSEHIGIWNLMFNDGQKCRMTTGIKDMYGTNVVDYLCFWSPEGAAFRLVDSTMKCAYEGRLENDEISMHRFMSDDSITLNKLQKNNLE